MDKILIARVRALRSAFDAESLSLEKREVVTTNVVAALIADRLPVPSSRIESNPKIHFVNMHQSEVNNVIGMVNEQHVLNIDAVQRRVYQIWKERYDLMHYPLKGVKNALSSILGEESNGEIEFICAVVGSE